MRVGEWRGRGRGECEGVSTSGGVSGMRAEDEDGWTTPHWEGEGRERGCEWGES